MPQATANTEPKPVRKHPRLRRLARWTSWLLLSWLSASGFATLWMTHRFSGPRPEPVPTLDWGTLEQVRLSTTDGQQIGAWLNRKGSRPAVVLFLHGVGDSRPWWLEQMHAVNDLGYASMAISFRAHGDSTGHVEDFGWSARHDVVAAVQWLQAQFPGRPVVLVGNSLGSAAAIYASGELGHDAAGYLLESPYYSLEAALRSRTQMAPFPLGWLAFEGMRLWGHLLLPESADIIAPIDHVVDIPPDVPVTFFAARNDPLCLLWEVDAQYRRIQSHARLVVAELKVHGACSRLDRKGYEAELADLLGRADSKAR